MPGLQVEFFVHFLLKPVFKSVNRELLYLFVVLELGHVFCIRNVVINPHQGVVLVEHCQQNLQSVVRDVIVPNVQVIDTSFWICEDGAKLLKSNGANVISLQVEVHDADALLYDHGDLLGAVIPE